VKPVVRANGKQHPGGIAAGVEAPLVWTFDGPFATCLSDMEDTFRRAIIQVGDVSRIAVQIDLSLPALKPRIDAGEKIQPAWGNSSNALRSAMACPPARACDTFEWRVHWRRWSSPTGDETWHLKGGSCTK